MQNQQINSRDAEILSRHIAEREKEISNLKRQKPHAGEAVSGIDAEIERKQTVVRAMRRLIRMREAGAV